MTGSCDRARSTCGKSCVRRERKPLMTFPGMAFIVGVTPFPKTPRGGKGGRLAYFVFNLNIARANARHPPRHGSNRWPRARSGPACHALHSRQPIAQQPPARRLRGGIDRKGRAGVRHSGEPNGPAGWHQERILREDGRGAAPAPPCTLAATCPPGCNPRIQAATRRVSRPQPAPFHRTGEELASEYARSPADISGVASALPSAFATARDVAIIFHGSGGPDRETTQVSQCFIPLGA